MGSFGKYKIHIFSMHHFFNSRTRVGCGWSCFLYPWWWFILTHAPTWGATFYDIFLPPFTWYFNSRTHVGCDRKYTQKQITIFIHPAYTCTYLLPFPQQKQDFLSLYQTLCLFDWCGSLRVFLSVADPHQRIRYISPKILTIWTFRT